MHVVLNVIMTYDVTLGVFLHSILVSTVFFFRVATPFSVARCVMEKSPHSMLVGGGAQEFARRNGFPVESNLTLQMQKSREAFEVRWKYSAQTMLLP